jgi:hypothetical protein
MSNAYTSKINLGVATSETHSGKSSIVGPANQGGCIIRSVGNLVDEKFQAFNKVSHMKFSGTVVQRLTELLPNYYQHRQNRYHDYIFK